MSEHIVQSFDEELQHIDRLVREMGDLAGAMLASATRALVTSDNALAQRTVSEDVVMDAKQRDLDTSAITLIAKRQPMAQDLRSVVGAIRMASDLERIGDLAKNIAKRGGAVGDGGTPRRLSHGIEAMAALVEEQVAAVVQHYVARDAEKLRKLRADDEKIDVQYTAVFRELLTYMMEDPRNITACTHLLFCAKNLERIGDHVTNIAENAYFIVTGTQLPTSRPKLDETTLPTTVRNTDE
jgi:phosphate transport system protein